MNMLKYLAIAALAFQAFHFAEHGIQLGYWFAHPLSAPWMTPWAMAAVQALALAGDHALGNELLHLGGNIIFLSGLVAFGCYWRGRHGASNSPHLRTAVSIQGIHVAEHVALTLTMVVWGKAIGVTTLFGLATGRSSSPAVSGSTSSSTWWQPGTPGRRSPTVSHGPARGLPPRSSQAADPFGVVASRHGGVAFVACQQNHNAHLPGARC